MLFLDPALHIYLSADPAELERAEKLVSERGEFHRNLRHIRLPTTPITVEAPSHSTIFKKTRIALSTANATNINK